MRLIVYDNLAPAEAAWRTLSDNASCYVFQTFEWISLWYRTIGRIEQVEPLLVCLMDDAETPLAMVPLGIRHRYGCRILAFLGGDVTDYNAPLFRPDVDRATAADQLRSYWRRIVRIAGADLVWLQRMPENLPDGTNPLVTAVDARHADNAYAAAPLPTNFTEFTAGRSRAYFADTRRKRRKLERIGPLTLNIPESPPDVWFVVEAMLRQKRRRIAESAGRPMSPQHESFFRALATATIPEGRPHIASLHVGGELVATHVGALHRDRFYWLMPGYEAGDWARLSVGRVLLHSLVEWCVANQVGIFDLTVGDEEYKRFWADTRMRLYECRYAVTLRGACFLAASRARSFARGWRTPPLEPTRRSVARAPPQG